MNHTHSFRNSGSRRPWFSDDFAVWGPVTQSTRRHRSECPSRPHPRPGLRAGSSALVLGTCPWWGAQGPPWGAGRAPRSQRGLRRDRREPSFAKAPSPSRVARGLRPPRPRPRGRQVCRALPASARRSSCLPRGSCPRRRRPPASVPVTAHGARGAPTPGDAHARLFPSLAPAPAGGLALAEGASVPPLGAPLTSLTPLPEGDGVGAASPPHGAGGSVSGPGLRGALGPAFPPGPPAL